MSSRHTLLQRQLRKFFADGEPPPGSAPFVEAVNQAYSQFDDDRRMLERSLDLSSNELMEANSELRAIFDAVPDLLLRLDRHGRVIDAKAGKNVDFGVPLADLVGISAHHPPWPDATLKFREAMAAVTTSGERIAHAEYEVEKNGRTEFFEARFAPLERRGEVAVIIRNITRRKRTEDELKQGLSLLQSTLESTADGILVVNAAGQIISYNRRFADMWRMPQEIMESRDDERALSHVINQLQEPQQFLEKVRELYAAPHAESFDVLRFTDGRVFERYSIPQRVDGVPVGRVWSFRDMTARARAEERLIHDAIHDALTSLPNRTLFMDRLDHALRRSKRRLESRFAVLFVDLDRFKVVNDSLGHLLGDQLLVGLATRIRGCLRPADTVARLGGDEFAVLLDTIEQAEDAVSAAERVRNVVAAPFDLNGHEVFVTASVGIAVSAPHYSHAEELLRDADIAMYRAKAMGRARHEVFQPGMHTTAVALLQLENDLRRAVERNEFALHYQPIVRLRDGAILGFEALIRWDHPQRGTVLPSEFIGIAEETGLVVPIGLWVLEQACERIRAWQCEFHRDDLTMSVNLSARQLMTPGFGEHLEKLLRDNELPRGTICLEMTETMLVENQAWTQPLRALRDLGVQLHIDDFGIGYSSLSYLHRMPVDALKIDRSFISHMELAGENLEIVRTIITLAENLQIRIIAEGVESEKQCNELRMLGCYSAQGFFFSLPADEDAVRTMIGSGHWPGPSPRLNRPTPSPPQSVAG
jgi:diguanylate cyclase (GGDEF)-like protein/PAS domain S-box-containing protein